MGLRTMDAKNDMAKTFGHVPGPGTYTPSLKSKNFSFTMRPKHSFGDPIQKN